MARSFSPSQRTALFLAADGVCEDCGRPLEPGFHGDHQLAWAGGGETDVVNGAALCPTCNERRGVRDAGGDPVETLRDWQRRALVVYEQRLPVDFLMVGTPGSGKTRASGTIAGRHLRSGRAQLIVVVVPTERLKGQWADDVSPCGIQLEPTWANSDGALPPGFDGVVVTYGQVAAQPDLLRRHVSRRPAVVILDEIHHCGATRSWGDAVRHAFSPARWRIALSGTPFRSDNNAIPFVRYVDGVGQPDITYDYGEAIADGVCRPVFFPRRGGRMEWATPAGEVVRATFDDELDAGLVNQRLRTALSLRGDWLGSVLADAHGELVELRRSVPDAAGLVISSDQAHAQGIADLLRSRQGVEPVLVTSDEPGANERIEAFAAGDAPWIVAVRMVSEGIDIPRLRVGVYAAAVTTELFFRQAVGRLVRVVDAGAGETSSMYIPDDPRLRSFATTIREQRDHVLDQEADTLLEQNRQGEGATTGSFVPIAAEALDVGGIYDGAEITPAELAYAEELKACSPETRFLPAPAVAVLLRLAGRRQAEPVATPAVAPPEHRRRKSLRDANHKVARRIAYRYGLEYADVNRRLNAAVGIAGVVEATIDQLVRRLELAQSWHADGALVEAAGSAG